MAIMKSHTCRNENIFCKSVVSQYVFMNLTVENKLFIQITISWMIVLLQILSICTCMVSIDVTCEILCISIYIFMFNFHFVCIHVQHGKINWNSQLNLTSIDIRANNSPWRLWNVSYTGYHQNFWEGVTKRMLLSNTLEMWRPLVEIVKKN